MKLPALTEIDPASAVDAAYAKALRPVLFKLGGGDPEVAHEQTLRAVKLLGLMPPAKAAAAALHVRPQQSVNIAGIDFPGPVGLAAGVDKFGAGIRAWGSLGFSHVELGTVTAQAQPGNPKPRLFRAVESQGIVNRMGFNNAGADAMADTLAKAGVIRANRAMGVPLGISLGKTKVTPLDEAVEDYLYSFNKLARYADYIAINVSSPNTPGLRRLQDGKALAEILTALSTASHDHGDVPIFVKVAPDLEMEALDEVLGVCLDHGAAGLIATNTTLSREGLAASDQHLAEQAGGLSGAPLTARAREIVGYICNNVDLPVIGVGGIMTGDDAKAMFDAGARLVQVYSGYIYRGPALVNEINSLEPRYWA